LLIMNRNSFSVMVNIIVISAVCGIATVIGFQIRKISNGIVHCAHISALLILVHFIFRTIYWFSREYWGL
jgi:hypothetical protein